MLITKTFAIHAPIDRVFDTIYDDEKLALWVPEFKGNEYPAGFDKNNPIGKPFTHMLKEGRRTTAYTGEILEYNPPEKLVMKITGKQFSILITYILTPIQDDTTQLAYSAKTETTGWLFALLVKIFAGFTRRIAEKQMAGLKRVAEIQ